MDRYLGVLEVFGVCRFSFFVRRRWFFCGGRGTFCGAFVLSGEKGGRSVHFGNGFFEIAPPWIGGTNGIDGNVPGREKDTELGENFTIEFYPDRRRAFIVFIFSTFSRLKFFPDARILHSRIPMIISIPHVESWPFYINEFYSKIRVTIIYEPQYTSLFPVQVDSTLNNFENRRFVVPSFLSIR